MREVLDFVESWICRPENCYSQSALYGLFGMTLDKIAAAKKKRDTMHFQCHERVICTQESYTEPLHMNYREIALVFENERLRTALAQADQLISAHANAIDPAPRHTWPKGSILEQAVARHEQRINAYEAASNGHSDNMAKIGKETMPEDVNK